MVNHEEHVGLVKSLARRIAKQRPTADVEDLVQIGMIKLLDLCKRFDPSRGHKFADYAGTSLRREMHRWADYECSRRNIMARSAAARRKAALITTGGLPSSQDWRGDKSLVVDSDEAAVDKAEQIRWVRIMLGTIGGRDEKIMRDRYGLDTGKPMTLEAIGAKYGIARSRVGQIIDDVVARIRELEEK